MPEEVSDVLDDVIYLTINGWTFSALLVVGILLYVIYPENFEKIYSHFLKLFRWISSAIDKRYIKHDMQGRMNSFIKRMDKKIHSFSAVKIDLQFFNESVDPRVYLDGGKYFVRVKRSADPNRNFVNIAMTFISDNLLKDAKKQISVKQKSAIDLFVAKKLFAEEKQEVMHEFVSEFLQPLTDDDKIRQLFSKFVETDRAGLLFPIFLQEMVFLGRRVFASPKNNKVQEEVAHLIHSLFEHSNRVQGRNMEKNRFIGRFSKFAFMIIGKNAKVQAGKLHAYKNYLRELMTAGIESIYLVGRERIQDFINQVSPDELLKRHGYVLHKKENYPSQLKMRDGTYLNDRTYLLLIRKRNIDPFIQNVE